MHFSRFSAAIVPPLVLWLVFTVGMNAPFRFVEIVPVALTFLSVGCLSAATATAIALIMSKKWSENPLTSLMAVWAIEGVLAIVFFLESAPPEGIIRGLVFLLVTFFTVDAYEFFHPRRPSAQPSDS